MCVACSGSLIAMLATYQSIAAGTFDQRRKVEWKRFPARIDHDVSNHAHNIPSRDGEAVRIVSNPGYRV
jgi:hypothetical protein